VMLAEGTRVRIIDPGIMVHEVRLEDGPHKGKSVFLGVEFVKQDE
jgi:hypothetical protein